MLEGDSPNVAYTRPDISGLETALRSQLNVAVGELADDEGEDEEMMRRRIESEEARKKLDSAKLNTAKAALATAQKLGGAAAPSQAAAAPSSSAPLSWSQANALKKAAGGGGESEKHVTVSGVKNDRILSEDTKAFPSLSGNQAAAAAASVYV